MHLISFKKAYFNLISFYFVAFGQLCKRILKLEFHLIQFIDSDIMAILANVIGNFFRLFSLFSYDALFYLTNK